MMTGEIPLFKYPAKDNTVHLGCFIVLPHPHPNPLPDGEGTFNSLPFKGRVGVGMGQVTALLLKNVLYGVC